jgi:hypothetical protein
MAVQPKPTGGSLIGLPIPFRSPGTWSGLTPCGQAPVVIFDGVDNVPPADRAAEQTLSVQQDPEPKRRPAAAVRPPGRAGYPVFGRSSSGR